MSPVLEETIYVDFIVCSSTGAAADADSTPTAEVFEDATDTTVVALTVTKRTSKTGNYRIPIACTAANGFEAGKSYNVIVSATVGGVATKAVAARFQVRAYSADNALRPTVAGRTLDVSAGGEAGLDWANVGSPTTTVALSGTTVATATTVGTLTTYTGNTPQTGDAYLRLGAPAGASIAADIATRSTYAGADTSGTTSLLSRLTSTRAGYLDNLSAGAVALATQIPANFTTATFASAGVFSTGALANAPTGTGGGSGLDAAATRAALGLASANLDTQLATLATATNLAAVKTDTAAISAKTTNLPASPAAVGSAMTLTTAYDPAKTAAQAGDGMTLTTAGYNAAADALLDRAAGIETGETPRQFFRKVRAVWLGVSTAAGVFKRKDGTTTSVSVSLDGAGARTSITDGTN